MFRSPSLTETSRKHFPSNPNMSTTGLPSSKEYPVEVSLSVGERLYLNEEMANFDFVFELDDGQHERIPAHKNFLAFTSTVFYAMFNADWIEKSEVKIVDASPSAFKEFLQFIYLPRAKVTAENVTEFMNLGNKYDIPECLDACKDFLIKTLTNETMCSGYELAILLDQKDLLEFCGEMIKSHANDVFASASFLESNQIVLEHILRFKWISCTAVDLVGAFMSWVKSISKQQHLTREIVQEHLKGLFYKMPFASMRIEEFVEFHRTYAGLLIHDEYKEIVKMIRSLPWKPKIFRAKREMLFGNSLKWNKDALIRCNRQIQKDSYALSVIRRVESTSFSTNKAILLGAIVFVRLFVDEEYYVYDVDDEYDEYDEYPPSMSSHSDYIPLSDGFLTKITITEAN